MKYSSKSHGETYGVEILPDGIHYSEMSKKVNNTKFIAFENISNNVERYTHNRSTWVESYNYKYFLVVALGFGIFSYISVGIIDTTAILFLFIALIFLVIFSIQ